MGMDSVKETEKRSETASGKKQDIMSGFPVTSRFIGRIHALSGHLLGGMPAKNLKISDELGYLNSYSNRKKAFFNYSGNGSGRGHKKASINASDKNKGAMPEMTSELRARNRIHARSGCSLGGTPAEYFAAAGTYRGSGNGFGTENEEAAHGRMRKFFRRNA